MVIRQKQCQRNSTKEVLLARIRNWIWQWGDLCLVICWNGRGSIYLHLYLYLYLYIFVFVFVFVFVFAKGWVNSFADQEEERVCGIAACIQLLPSHFNTASITLVFLHHSLLYLYFSLAPCGICICILHCMLSTLLLLLHLYKHLFLLRECWAESGEWMMVLCRNCTSLLSTC